MSNGECIAANVARLRLDRRLTQGQLAARAGISRMALGKIERGAVVPRAGTLADLAAALAVPIGELVAPVRPLQSVRFRAKAQVHGREQILAVVTKWLDAYCWLEAELDDRRTPRSGFRWLRWVAALPRRLRRTFEPRSGFMKRSRCGTSAGSWRTTGSSSSSWRPRGTRSSG